MKTQHERTSSTYAKNAEKYKRQEFDDVPCIVVLDVEQNKMIIAERVERSKDERSGQSTEEWAPQSF